jgi:hypothetical protein
MYGIIIKKLEVKNIRKINERLEIERKILEDLISDIDINNDKFSINDLILYQSMKVDKLIIIYEKLNNKCFLQYVNTTFCKEISSTLFPNFKILLLNV